jgi:hypothetical protein
VTLLGTTLRPLDQFARGLRGVPYSLISVAVVAAAVATAWISLGAFIAFAVLTLIVFAVGAVRWPRALLIAVALTPILDRFLLSRLLPPSVADYARYLSEALLLVVGIVIFVQAVRQRRVLAALRHPLTPALAAFVALSALSAIVNGVPIKVALLGTAYTVDAVLLFFLPRLVQYRHADVVAAVGVFVAAMVAAALVSVAQAILSPTILGLDPPVIGRSGESGRLGSIVRDPNTMGTLLGMAIPFATFSIVRVRPGAWRLAAAGITFVMTVALLLTYSRGAWLGVAVGFGLALIILERRALLAFALIVVLALATVWMMPRNLLASSADGSPAPQFDPFGTTEERIRAIPEGRDLRTMFLINALPIIRDHPLIGVGPGRYGGAAAWNDRSPVYEEYGTDEVFPTWYVQRTVDNFWLHVLVEGGILGAGAFIGGLIVTGVLILRRLRGQFGLRYAVLAGTLGGSAVLIISTGTTMLLEGNTAAFLFWFLLGLASLYVPGEAQPAGFHSSA